jgi:hypothetical protein
MSRRAAARSRLSPSHEARQKFRVARRNRQTAIGLVKPSRGYNPSWAEFGAHARYKITPHLALDGVAGDQTGVHAGGGVTYSF